MSGALKLCCQTKGGQKPLEGLKTSSTIEDLLRVISKVTAIPLTRLKVKTGFPPKAIDTTDVHRSLSDLQVRSGDKFTVDEDAAAESLQSLSRSDRLLQEQLASSTRGILQRKVVPSDNSCLFTSINAVMSDGTVNLEKAAELRQVIAGVVMSDESTYTEAFLGRPNREYVKWIQDKDSWGGGIELSILSDYFQREIVIVDCQTAKLCHFGEDKQYEKRVFLLYDGVHYDPLVLQSLDGTDQILQLVFMCTDSDVMSQAADIAQEAQSSRQFTNMAEFTLYCGICNTPLKGAKEAQQHALETKHDQYREYKPQF